MGYNGEDLELASDFEPMEGEANFGSTITREVVGGSHIAPHCITLVGDRFVMVEFEEGLPRHDSSGPTIRFPHGLMLFGETFEACAERLVLLQMGGVVESVRVAHIYSQLDEANHWHLEPILLVRIGGDLKLPNGVTRAVYFEGGDLPDGGVWRGKPPFTETYSNYLKDLM